jgi:hypothetical protein
MNSNRESMKQGECPVCFNNTLISIPDYETVEQYEKRTGKKFSKNGAVWVGTIMREEWITEYCVEWTALSLDQLYDPAKTDFILCVSDPIPPPYNWRPE